jgi:hypothetical protein
MMVFAKAFGEGPSLAKLSQRQLAAVTLSLVERPWRDHKGGGARRQQQQGLRCRGEGIERIREFRNTIPVSALPLKMG